MKNRVKNFFPSLPIFLTSLSFFAVTVATAQIPSSGLVGYWNFSGNVNDASSNGNNGIMQPGNNGSINFVTDRFGNSNSAIEFTSNPTFSSLGPYIEIPNSQNLLVNSDFTMSYSIKVSAQNVIGEIINKGADAIANSYFSRVANGILQNSIPTSGIINVSNFPIGSWQTVTITYSNSLLSYYLNGVFQQSVASGPIQSSSSKYYFGSMVSGSTNGSYYPFQGIMDDISIYNRALTPAEITQIYTSQTSTVATPPCPTLATNLLTGLVGYWPFCGNANDESGNGNNGTVNGATLTTDRFGNSNSAYSFDGLDDCIDIGTSSSLDFGSSQILTVNYWVQASNGADYRTVISRYYQGVANNSSYGLNYGGDNIGVYGNGTVAWMVINSPTGVNWNEITIVMNKSAGTAQIYKNGIFVTSGNVNYNSGISSVITSIGRMYAGSPGSPNSNHFNGKIDDISIYNRALTPTEIAQLYTDQSTTPPVACTPFLGEDQTVCAGTSLTLNATSAVQLSVLDSLTYLGQNNGHYYYLTNFTSNPQGQVGTELTPAEMQSIISASGAYLATIQSSQENSFIANSLPPDLFAVWIGLSDYIQEGSYVWLNGTPASYYAWRSGEPNNQGNEDFTIMYGATSYPGAFSLWNDEPCGEGSGPCNPFYFVIESESPLQVNSDSFVWSTGATTATINVTPSTTTTYTCTVTDANGNVCTDSVTVFVPQIEATDLTICAGETTTLSVSGINSTATPSACATLPTNLQTGLVGYWPFCGNANDASGNGNNGTVNGATLTTDRFGNANSAYSFDGADDYIALGDMSSQIDGLSEMTLNYWLKSDFQFNLYQGWSIGGVFSHWINNGQPTSAIGFQTSVFQTGQISHSCVGGEGALSQTTLTPQTDAMVTILYRGANSPNERFAIFINGQFVEYLMLPSSNSQLGNLGNMTIIGGYVGPDSGDNVYSYFKGLLDDMVLHNRALSVSEIQQLYTLGQTTYSWSNGATTPTINVSPTSTTTYTCTVTTNGVSCTDSVTVAVNNPAIDLGADVTVCGTSTTLTAPSGYDSYLWSNSGTTNTTTVNANGTYSCTVTQGGCSATDAVDVTLVNATVSASDSTICAGQSVTLSVPQGGSTSTACAALPTNLQTGLIGYWPFCGNANDASGNGNNGTVNGPTLTADRFGNANSAYSFSRVNSQYLNGSLTLSGNQFTESIWAKHNYGYTSNCSSLCNEWLISIGQYTPIEVLELGTYFNGTNLSTGKYNDILFQTQAVLSTSWTHYVVTHNNGMNTIYQDGVFKGSYSGAPINLTGNCGFYFGRQWDPYLEFWDGKLDDISIYNRALSPSEIQQLYTLGQSTYLWSTGATTATINVTPSTTTTYTCTITTNGVSCTDEVTVVVSQPVASITPNGIVEICQGQSIALTANGGVSYLWNTGAPTQSITVNTEAVYSVTVTDANGCTDTESQLVKLNQLPNIGVNNASICPGQSTTLTATGGLSYVWSPATGLSSTTGTTVTASPSTSTVYIVTGTGANGCTNTATAAVAVNAAPTATITPATATTFCQGGSVVLNANTGTGLLYQWFNNTAAISGATTSSYTANASGSYTVVVTNTSTCSATSAATVVTVNALLTATITPATATTFCQGGSVVLNANTGSGLTYQWRLNGTNITGATTSSYTANASGSYTVVVTNTSTCSSTSTATVVTVNALPTATITPATTTTFCQGGSVVLNANTGTGLSYQWFNNAVAISGATTSSYTANASGSYTVVMTNTSTCSATSTATVVTVNALPTATITPATTTTFCQGGSVVLNANTGTGLTYQWFNNAVAISGATTSAYTANASGSYTVFVTNVSTCSSTSTATVVTVNALPTATITASSATTFCQGGSVVLNANTGAGLSYQWFNNAVAISGATTSSYTANASGSYTVVVTNTSTCSSTSTATVVTVNALPTATITPATATTFCQGGSVVLNANTGTGLSYQWRLNGTNITGATTSSYTANASGSYTVVVTNTSTCSATSTATVVTVNSVPTATITASSATTFCQGGSVVLTANTGTGLSYQWRLNGTNITGATSSSYTANGSGSYTVVVTNASTCSATSIATVVTVNALPTATITPATAITFCQGGSVVLNANTGTGLSYQWFNNAVAIGGAITSSYTANASGSYTVVVTNTSACSATSIATVVTVNALPTATITPATATTFCQGGSVVLNANTGVGLTYQWRLNGNTISGATSSSYTANASGSYTVVVTNTSTCSATSAATVVTVNALPTSTITASSATTFCQGGSVVLTANSGTGLSYQWRLNGTNITGATTSTYTANASGSYTVVVTNTSPCSATSTATVVTVNALPTATITPATATTFCQGGSVVLNANTGTGLTYQWRLNGTNITGATTSTYTANASGSYTVVVTNTSACSATSTATVVTVNVLPVASISPNGLVEICQGQSIALTANGGVTYLWSTGAPTQSITVSTEALYTVTVTDINGCTDTESQFVKVNLLPNIGVNNASICLGQPATLTATGGLSYVWSPATGLSGTTGSTVSSSTTTNAAYIVTGAGANGCTNSATATVTVNALPTATINAATTTTFCQGGSVVLNANNGAGLTYQWFNNGLAISGAISASYTVTTSGSYTVTVTNASTCSATSIAIDVTTIPNIDYYADTDGDGYGDVTTLLSTCVQPQGYVTNSSDCNDNNAAIFLGAMEICNDIDDDCNGLIDDGLVFNTYYADVDGDSFGDINNPLDACMMPAGYVTNNTDCNDNNANQNSSSAEICNGEDDDCDGTIDNGITFFDYYADTDGDGFGAGEVISSCSDLGAGYVSNNTDCDDTNANAFLGATEICNTIDDNCDGQTDEGVQTVYFIDNDGDTYGNPSVSILACTQPIGYTPDDTDCNDTDANINPGAEDIGGNGIDENCDGEIDNSIFELNATISLYPNPTRSELNIQVNSSIIGNDLYIFDAVGKLVFKEQLLSTQTTIPVSNFADGNYVVRVGEVVKRFVVEK